MWFWQYTRLEKQLMDGKPSKYGAALSVLMSDGSSRAVGILRQAVERHRNPEARLTIARALKQCGHAVALPQVETAAINKKTDVRSEVHRPKVVQPVGTRTPANPSQRSDVPANRKAEGTPGSSAPVPDPALVNELVRLLQMDAGNPKTKGGFGNRERIRQIGEALNRQGGISLMRKAYYAASSAGVYFSQDIWHEIGDWRW